VLDVGNLECMVCGGMAVADGPEGAPDLHAEAQAWPTLPCQLTPGCSGLLVPQPFN
jgi:hypothetical protein